MNSSLSLAYAPTFNGTKVTIKLKNYKWSDGTKVTAQNVVFWLNMELAEPQNYGAYTGFPANVNDISVVSCRRSMRTATSRSCRTSPIRGR